MPRATENDVALAVLQIATAQAKGICTFNRACSEVPNYVAFEAADLQGSVTRPGEPMWHQLIRNIKSHHTAEGNFIAEGYLQHVPRRGYRATPAGRAYLKKLGL
jgi:hypothetical protein